MAMRSLFWLALLFAVAVALAVSGQLGQGHVILVYPPWRLDMSLVFLAVAVVAVFVIAYVLVRVLRAVFSLPRRVGAYRERSRDQKAHRALREALKHLFAGRFEKAEKAARQSAELARAPEAASLIAARAAQGMREYQRRDEWLARVDGSVDGPAWQEARWLTAADMHLEAQDAEAAGAALTRAEENGAKRLHTQRLAWRIARRRGDWHAVLTRQKALDKREVLPSETAMRVRHQALEHLLQERRADADALLEFWQQLSAADRESPRLADLAAGQLIALDRHADAARIVEQALAANWDARLLRRYAQCAHEDDARLPIQRVEAWQIDHPDDADLLYALGRLCQRQRLWGKAQASYEQALAHAADARLRYRIYRGLGELHEALGDAAAADRSLRAAALALDPH